jgi:hypothetical protein
METPFAEIAWNFNPLKEDFVLPVLGEKAKIHHLSKSVLTAECINHLKQLRLFPHPIQLFVEPPYGYNPIHIDGQLPGHNLPSINWDLNTDRKGHMKWYKLKDGVRFPEAKLNDSGTTYLQFQEENCDMTHEQL